MQLLVGSTAAAFPAPPEHAPQEAQLGETTGAISSLAELDTSGTAGGVGYKSHC